MVAKKDDKANAESDANTNSQEISENSGMRAARIASDPSIGLEQARNANEGKAPNASGGNASSTVEEHIPSRSDPKASDLPSSNKPN